MDVTKKIITQNPVIMEVDGRETSASITCTVRTVESGDCIVNYIDNTYAYIISLQPLECDQPSATTTGDIDIDGVTLSYEIRQIDYACDGEAKCSCSCQPLRSWTIPYYIPEDYSGEVEFYYEYYHISADTESEIICSKEKRIGHKQINVPSDIGVPIEIVKDCEDCVVTAQTGNTIIGCQSESGTTVKVNFSVYPEEVPNSGGTVEVICYFKKITIDEDCNKRTKSGSFTLIKEVGECDLPDDECCDPHMAKIEVTIEELREKLRGIIGDGSGVKFFYNDVEFTDNVEVEVKQNAKRGEECSGACEKKTTYCVDSSSLGIWYESLYGKGDWDLVGRLTRHGGRIKVTWNYTAHTITTKCTEKDVELLYEGFMEIGDCDDPYHPTDYEVLFKEQTPGCETCDSEYVYECANCQYQESESFSVCPVCNGTDILEIPYNKLVIVPNQEDCGSSSDCDCTHFSILGEITDECDCMHFSILGEITDDCDCMHFTILGEITDECDCMHFSILGEITDECDCNHFSITEEIIN